AQITALNAESSGQSKALASCEKWLIDFSTPHDLIVAGNTLIAGLDREVRALDLETGKVIWSAPIIGRAMGLAAINGRLYVSSDQGKIHAFAAPK
ncbi:MAG: PQQ-binding-like beta-propeller repeat protein, partial [Akkermansiaceae bacterium]